MASEARGVYLELGDWGRTLVGEKGPSSLTIGIDSRVGGDNADGGSTEAISKALKAPQASHCRQFPEL